MHEASLINNLLKKIELLCKKEKANKVTSVTVWLGALCHISPDHFREHFEHETKGTLAQNATLYTQVDLDIHHDQAQDILLKSIDVENEN